MTTLIGCLVLAVLLMLGTPVAFAMAIAGAVGLYMIGGLAMVLGILKTTAFSVANSYEIITIPMFILMAEFVILSGVADDLFTAASAWVGRLRGGLA
ncbi:MAG: TRAP transporter large permease subunit, partial [Xanthobacteraceae bacterium]